MKKISVIAFILMSTFANASIEVKSVKDLEAMNIHQYTCITKTNGLDGKEYKIPFSILAKSISDANLEFAREYGLKDSDNKSNPMTLTKETLKTVGALVLPISTFTCVE